MTATLKERPALTVHLLDTDALTRIAREVYLAQYGQKAGASGAEDIVADRLVYAYLPDDNLSKWQRLTVICTEGVGWEPDENNLVPISYHNGWRSGYVMAGTSRLIDEALTTDEVNLADFIRKFGDRLENNYSIWYHRLAATA